MLLGSLAEMTERGLKGASLSRRRKLVVRASSMLAFLAVWSLGSGLVALLKLFNPIFLPGPWVVLGAVAALAIDGSLWGHLGATLGRVAAGFTTGTALGEILPSVDTVG